MKKIIIGCLVFIFLGLGYITWDCIPSEATWFGDVNKTELSNGLTIITKENHSLPIVAVQMWVKVGSINEDKSNNGISHFIEHMLFKGTTRRGVGEISKEIEIRGGEINAATSKDFTYYHIVIPSEHLHIALDILGDASMNATFPQEEIERERLVILEEIKRRQDNPSSHLWDLLNEKLYISSPYRFKVLGTEEVVRNITRDTLRNYYKKFYLPTNIYLVVVGDFKTKRAIRDIKKLFDVQSSSFYRKGISEKGAVPMDMVPGKKEEVEIKKKVKQAYLRLGFLGPNIKDEEQYAMDVLAYILGRGRSSRLYRDLREEKKLVWSIEVWFLTHKGQGPFVISAACEPAKIRKVCAGVLEEIAKIKNGVIDEKELKKAKMMIESDYLLSNETFAGQAFSLGYYETLYTHNFVQSYLERVSRVNTADIIKVANKYLDLGAYTLAVIRPYK